MDIQKPPPVFPYYRSPSSIRDEVFTQRLRGLDQDEVNEYLNLLADQVEACERERTELFEEIYRLRGEVARLRGSDPAPGTDESAPQAAVVLSQAQQVADQLVEEAVSRTRELIASAHEQQRQILEAAHRAAEASAREAAQVSARNITTYVSASAPEVEYARKITQVAQVQLRSVLETLCEQVEQLGEVSRLWQAGPPASYATAEAIPGESRWEVRRDALPTQPAYRLNDVV